MNRKEFTTRIQISLDCKLENRLNAFFKRNYAFKTLNVTKTNYINVNYFPKFTNISRLITSLSFSISIIKKGTPKNIFDSVHKKTREQLL